MVNKKGKKNNGKRNRGKAGKRGTIKRNNKNQYPRKANGQFKKRRK